MGADLEKVGTVETTIVEAGSEKYGSQVDIPTLDATSPEDVHAQVEHMLMHRKLRPRQMQLASIAGSIGAALFIGIGGGLAGAGPLGLLVAFLVWMTVIWGCGQCQIETVTLFPVDGAMSELPARFVDPAWGAAAAWNMLFMQAAFLTFETSAFNSVVAYWQTYNPAIFITVLLAVWFALNIWRTDIFGEGEFVMSIFKVLLTIGLAFYTLCTMSGANPEHKAYGFDNWGLADVWAGSTVSQRVQAFIAGLITASFVMCGPEYITIVAGESKNPRRTIPRAFNTLLFRLGFFFVLGALSVGIVCPYSNAGLLGNSGTTASPYVISMNLLNIPVLPSIVNVCICTSIASAGNAYMFGGSRTLYAMALRGQAPKVFAKLNRHGVPYLCVCFMLATGTLSYLSCGTSSSKVLGWIISFSDGCMIMNWVVISFTYIRFYNALKKQNIDRETFLPVRSRFQPYISWYTLAFSVTLLLLQGYTVFLPGQWSTTSFIFNYGIIALMLVVGAYYKFIRRSKWIHGKDVDLHTGLAALNAYTSLCDNEREALANTRLQRVLNKLW